jgi:hypothetical protein
MTGQDQYTEFPPEIAPGHVVLPVLEPPKILTETRVLENEFSMVGAYIATTTDDAAERQMALQADVSSVRTFSQIPCSEFTRVLAHIGHAYNVSNPGAVGESLLLPIARGDLREASKFVGGWFANGPPPLPNPQSGIHQIHPFNAMIGGVGYVAAHIRLFTHLRPMSPIYTVLLCQRDIPAGDKYRSFTRAAGSNAVVDISEHLMSA